MKRLFILVFMFWSICCFGQNKTYTEINQLTELEGTEHVIATLNNKGKLFSSYNRNLLFIDTKTGETTQVDFPEDAEVKTFKQIKIDSLGINRVIVTAKTVDSDSKKGIGAGDPVQIIGFSTDGKTSVQLTEDSFYSETWTVNRHTGTIVIAGYYDSNFNRRQDKGDINEILIYNLKDFSLVAKM